jgi:squalene-hopene/tetraprenyl-beta-curcumene cyclase
VRFKVLTLIVIVISIAAGVAASNSRGDAGWSAEASAKYLDQREVWWQGWKGSQRDQGTVCVSCHTVVPYALSRPGLRGELKEDGLSEPEQKMVGYVRKRVEMWGEVKPFYEDSKAVPTRTFESRGTEAVLNALILTSYDRPTGHLSATTRKAFEHAWALQSTTGKDEGGWVWLNFHNAPWENDDSGYQGATFAALAVGMAPDGYAAEPGIQGHLAALKGYLQREYAGQPLENKLVLLWAASKLPGLMSVEQKKALAKEVLALQEADGGWSLSSFAGWKRHDGTPLETKSDGYATGLVVLALESNGLGRKDAGVGRGLAWLEANQNQSDGNWTAYSVNKNRDLKTDVGLFMSDAATAYATLALENSGAAVVASR